MCGRMISNEFIRAALYFVVKKQMAWQTPSLQTDDKPIVS
jgi:hypothetical protein